MTAIPVRTQRTFEQFIAEGLQTAIFDLDGTLARTDITKLYFHVRRQTFSNSLVWCLWKLALYLVFGLPFFVLDRIDRPTFQRVFFGWYSRFSLPELQAAAMEYFIASNHRVIEPGIAALLHWLKAVGIHVEIHSTNLEPFVQCFAEHFQVPYRAVRVEDRPNGCLVQTAGLRTFKCDAMEPFDLARTAVIADSPSDLPALGMAAFPVVVASGAAPWARKREITILRPDAEIGDEDTNHEGGRWLSSCAWVSRLIEAVPLAVRMLTHNRRRLLATAFGIAIAFFLTAAQLGLLVGWIDTNTALIRHAGADIWLMAEQAPAFDYGTAIPRQRIYQARSVPGVESTEGIFMGWNWWQRGDGRRVCIELVGLDTSNAGGPWKMREGRLGAVHLRESVVVDELYRKVLGVQGVGERFEIGDQRATVNGISTGVRTFTASPFVFTSVEQAIRYDRRYSDDEITYVLVRCAHGANVQQVQAEIRRRIPNVDVLTSREFAVRSAKYWMLETGVGTTVLITAALGLGVGTLIMSQTLFAITQEHLSNYATLLALGFRKSSLLTTVIAQSIILGLIGIFCGTGLFFPAAMASARTPIPLETTPVIYAALVGVSLLTCVLASFMSVRTIFNLDPVTVFRQ